MERVVIGLNGEVNKFKKALWQDQYKWESFESRHALAYFHKLTICELSSIDLLRKQYVT